MKSGLRVFMVIWCTTRAVKLPSCGQGVLVASIAVCKSEKSFDNVVFANVATHELDFSMLWSERQ